MSINNKLKKNILEVTMEDDCVEYYVFPLIETEDEKEQEIILSNVLQKIDKIIAEYTTNYLWHKESFKLVPSTSSTVSFLHRYLKREKLPPHLYGISHFGRNIQDEWFIVYLLREITKEITGTIAKIFDADGEFLLIEAANCLPEWAVPETCRNRVYIYNGDIHIVPLQVAAKNKKSRHISTELALSVVRQKSETTLASAEVQHSITDKIGGYPGKLKEDLHIARVYLPVGVAAILKHKPSLIAPAIEALYDRDPSDLKACRAMRYFPPENRVFTNVTTTKFLYGMLTSCNYLPDRRTGWNVPLHDNPQYKSYMMGLRIATGFEILMSHAKPCVDSNDIDSNKGWMDFLDNLKSKNYFGDLLEHSQDYNNLLNKAKTYYINHVDPTMCVPSAGHEILELTKNLDYNYEEFKELESALPNEDDDSWLIVSAEEVEKMMKEKYDPDKVSQSGTAEKEQAATLSSKLKQFFNQMSDVEGVEFATDTSPSVSQFKIPEKRNTNQAVSKELVFEPDLFTSIVSAMAKSIPEDRYWNLESDSDLSDYADEDGIEESFDARFSESKINMEKYMEQMDKELAATTIGDSFEKKKSDAFDDVEDFQPIDIDRNALSNLMESYRLQFGDSGPTSNMLGPMGINLNPQEADDSD